MRTHLLSNDGGTDDHGGGEGKGGEEALEMRGTATNKGNPVQGFAIAAAVAEKGNAHQTKKGSRRPVGKRGTAGVCNV